ncbi:unnamed protein product [Paramecium primaurelia]|uniref:Uncharacterized protein n=1 Tax=Paramecium primaurelia TaxID=5886 RepID=A0A8S1LS24_PARPR|nr:unnamed protein product [Paramecium primaurelia]
MKNIEQQSIPLDQEFSDQNIFTYYQRSNQIRPKIRLFALQQNIIKRQPNDNVNHLQIQSSMNIIYIFMSLKTSNQQVYPNKVLPIEKTLKKNKIKLRASQLKYHKQVKNLDLQKEFQLRINQSYNLKRKIYKSHLVTQSIIKKKVYETPVYKDFNKHYTEQKPQTFRYKELDLNSYIEEYKLIKQQTIATVILPNVFQHQNRNDNSQSSRLSIQPYQHSFKPKIQNISISQNKYIQQKNFNISGWSDHSNK